MERTCKATLLTGRELLQKLSLKRKHATGSVSDDGVVEWIREAKGRVTGKSLGTSRKVYGKIWQGQDPNHCELETTPTIVRM